MRIVVDGMFESFAISISIEKLIDLTLQNWRRQCANWNNFFGQVIFFQICLIKHFILNESFIDIDSKNVIERMYNICQAPKKCYFLLFVIYTMRCSNQCYCNVMWQKKNRIMRKKTSLKMPILYISLRCDDERTVKMISEMKSNKCCNDG